jgi:excisionase family DNA binding protein
MNPQDRRAWRVQDFAEAYGISRPLVYKLMAAGELGYVQHGSMLRLIPVEEAERWFKAGKPSSDPNPGHRLQASKAAEARP